MYRKLPSNYWIYDFPYQTGIPTNQLFVHYFDKLPSKIKLNENFSYDVVDYLKNNGFTLEIKTIARVKKPNKKNEEMLFIHDSEILMIEIIYDSRTHDKESLDVSIYYDATYTCETDIKIINDIKLKFAKAETKCDIKLLKAESGYLDTEDFNLNIPEVDIELNYGKDFLKIHDRIIDKLNTFSSSGIILLHGDPGTGKTTYIKYLTSLIKEKDVIFIPPSTAEALSEPSIIPFLMDHRNSVLIIEDAEKVISDRENGGSSTGVSNILNLTDGILGDCLNIQIIATFNMKKERIDDALLRKGRLIAEHKFTNLSIKDSNVLLKHLGKDKIVTSATSLADIYNIDVEIFKDNSKKSIGFNQHEI